MGLMMGTLWLGNAWCANLGWTNEQMVGAHLALMAGLPALTAWVIRGFMPSHAASPLLVHASLCLRVLGALMLLDACIRLLPGVMGAASSGVEESFETGLLEYPHYTRPVEWEGRRIPEVLRSGDHAKIAAWRQRRAEEDTRLRRPDLWQRHSDAAGPPPSGARRQKKEE
jgi:hypothetical protein